MRVFFGLDNLPTFHHAIVTIGTFDGVHKGHQVILNRLKQKAIEENGETVIITFEPHPRIVLSGEIKSIFLLNTLEEKIKNLSDAGIDNLVVVEFTNEFASMQANDYIEQFLVKTFHPHTIIIGYDHQFGQGRHGNFELLEKYKPILGYDLEEIPMQVIADNKISSTKIREAIITGDMELAQNYLGDYYTLEGLVIEGRKMGRQIGYPTANVNIANEHKLIPAIGVYAVQVEVNQKLYEGMLNIGTNPTVVNSDHVHIEVHIFDFDKVIYNEKITIKLVKRIRDELKFDTIESLVNAIDNDKELSLAILNKIKT